MDESAGPLGRSNLAVLRGTVTNHPTRRALPSGAVVVQFDVTTEVAAERNGSGGGAGRSADGARVSVPVSWVDPPADPAWLVLGEPIVVVGTVRRRFFRANGVTQSRTEVVVEQAVPTRRAKTATKAVAAAVEAVLG